MHTKAPWKISNEGYGSYRIISGGLVICSRNQWKSREIESVCNGHLLSAAPDLLEAAQMALGVMRLMGWDTDPTTEKLVLSIEKATRRPA